ncbi:membrane protein [Microlunatus endophyticus]|uniref:Membrane protein n=1 Tax=Microlunatus endophyticus TaxID=1716077 RepID=A0A917S9K7_9ACTN|nr:M50 family metallopeptidase [Microlunatus endophyticus]GGL65564.1 membrane protein [Microlunatus endophyticus]
MEVVTKIWHRATAVQPAPAPGLVGAIAVLGLVLVLYRRCWPITRLLVTITHEGAHAVAAVLVGRRLSGIRLNSDTSGLTVSRGKPRGPGMVVMLAVGYLGPALAGIGAAWLLAAGRSIGLLWLVVVLLSLMLLMIRNFYGLLVLLVAGGGVFAISWYLTPGWQSAIAYLITWVLLIAAPKPVIELIMQRRQGRDHGSDVAQLVRLTSMPGAFWLGLFLLCSLAGLALGTAVLLPSLIALFRPMF